MACLYYIPQVFKEELHLFDLSLSLPWQSSESESLQISFVEPKFTSSWAFILLFRIFVINLFFKIIIDFPVQLPPQLLIGLKISTEDPPIHNFK